MVICHLLSGSSSSSYIGHGTPRGIKSPFIIRLGCLTCRKGKLKTGIPPRGYNLPIHSTIKCHVAGLILVTWHAMSIGPARPEALPKEALGLMFEAIGSYRFGINPGLFGKDRSSPIPTITGVCCARSDWLREDTLGLAGD